MICLIVAHTHGHAAFDDFQTPHLLAQHEQLSTRTTSSTRRGENRSRSRTRSRLEIEKGMEMMKMKTRCQALAGILGFVQLGMGGSSSGGQEGSGSRYPGLGVGRAAEKEKARGGGGEEPRSRRKLFSRFLIERNERERERESSHSPDTPPKATPPTPAPTPGRSFVGSVRRISLVGRHKRSKSGAVLGDVPPSPSAAFFRNPNAGQEPGTCSSCSVFPSASS
ncbi:hypothetical protein CPC08DRAFT_724986 [Agrocybe pediades]|nr:hypothetical protein CPC08DRAFT_724986 [Agrocybe pediades]